jgi:hypothetical protein
MPRSSQIAFVITNKLRVVGFSSGGTIENGPAFQHREVTRIAISPVGTRRHFCENDVEHRNEKQQPGLAVPDFRPDHRPFGGCDGAVLWPEVARMLSLTNRTEARIVKVSQLA